MGLVNPGQQSLGGVNGFSHKLGVSWPLNANSSSFDPLNPPGGPPVAAWLACDIDPVTFPTSGFWIASDGVKLIDFGLGNDVPTLVTVGGKTRVRCPLASGVVGPAFTDVTENTPFSVPTGACSIVLVSAALSAGVNGSGELVTRGDGDSIINPASDEGSIVVGSGSVDVSQLATDTEPHVIIIQKSNSGGWIPYVDGSISAGYQENLGSDWGELWIGRPFSYPNSDIVAILVFDRELFSQEITDYTTWGIAETGSE